LKRLTAIATLQGWRYADSVNQAMLEHARLLGALHNARAPMALVQIALDESGKLSDHKDIAFGGCVFVGEESNFFGRAWLRCLDEEAHAYTLHMKDAMRYEEDFAAWRGNETERDLILRKLAGIAMEHHPLLIACPMNITEFRSLPQSEQERLKNPVYYGFEACVRGVVDTTPEPHMHSIQVACDISDDYAAQTLKLFIKLRKQDDLIKRCCHAIAFGDDRYIPALQLADMFAYSCREYQSGTPRPVILDIIEILTGSRDLKPSKRMVYNTGSVELGSGILAP
jgi:hypothetical protein